MLQNVGKLRSSRKKILLTHLVPFQAFVSMEQTHAEYMIAARALATYLIPGCVGRGVRLGSESSSVAGGVWKSGNLEIWDLGNLEIWGPGNPEILRFGDLEIQNVGIQKIQKMKSLKNQIRSAQNVGKVWISRKKILPALFGAI